MGILYRVRKAAQLFYSYKGDLNSYVPFHSNTHRRPSKFLSIPFIALLVNHTLEVDATIISRRDVLLKRSLRDVLLKRPLLTVLASRPA